MIKRISESLAKRLCDTCSESADNKKVYSYGLYLLIFWGVTFLITLAFGMLLGAVEEVLLFHLFYMPLRKLSGGYHVRRPEMCFMLSIMIVIIAGLMIKYIDLGWTGCVVSTMLFLICLPCTPSLCKKSFTNREKLRIRTCVSCLVIVYEAIIIHALLSESDMITVENACMISIIFAEVLIIVNEILKKAGDNRKKL